jgi:hypothetical protein
MERQDYNQQEVEEYLIDLDNLIDTGHFRKESVRDFTYYHKDMTLRDFVSKGREIIRQSLITT